MRTIHSEYWAMEHGWRVFVPDELVEAHMKKAMTIADGHQMKDMIGQAVVDHLAQPRPAVLAARKRVQQNNLKRFPWLRAKPT